MTTKLTWTTKRVKLGDLLEWDKNPVQISERDAKELAKSLDKFDHVLPYVAAAPKNGHGLPLLDGHQRKMVEIQLNKVSPKTLVDVRIPSRKLTEKERQEIVVRLRKNTGTFDFDKLANFFDVPDLLNWGFTEKELLGEGFEIGDESKDAEPQIDRAAELLKKWKVKTGDLWQIGEHRLICGDSTDKVTYERLMGKKFAQMVMTSPPYWVGKDYENEKSWGAVLLFITSVSDAIVSYLPEQGRIVINTGTGMRGKFEGHTEISLLLDEWVKALRPHGWLMRHPRIWAKSGGLGGLVGPQSDVVDLHWEFIATFYRPHKPFIGQRRVSSATWANQGVWTDIQGNANQTGHVASFPTEIPERNIALYSDEGKIILEPFNGSGTTMVACENLRRQCYGIELDPAYVAVALQRMQDAFPGIEIKRVK